MTGSRVPRRRCWSSPGPRELPTARVHEQHPRLQSPLLPPDRRGHPHGPAFPGTARARGKRLLRLRTTDPAPTGPAGSLEAARLGTSDDSQGAPAGPACSSSLLSLPGGKATKGRNRSDTSSPWTGADREKRRWVCEFLARSPWRAAGGHPTMPMPWGSGTSVPLIPQVPAAHRGQRGEGGAAQLSAGGPGPQGHRLTFVPKQTSLRPPWVPRWHPEAGVSRGQGASSPLPPCSAPHPFLAPQQAKVPTPLHWGGT